MALQTATNPTTGERVALVGDQWQPITQTATNKQGAKAYLVGGNWLTDEPTAAPSGIPAPRKERGFFGTIGAPIQAASEGIISGVGNVMFGGQELLGQGLQALGLNYSSADLIADAQRRRAESQKRVAPFKQEFPISTGAGELGGEIIGTGPVGMAIAAPLKAIPAAAPLAQAIRTGGFSTGRAVQGAPAAARAVDLGTRVAGGAITGGTTAALVNPADAETGALIGGTLAVAAPPIVNVLAKSSGFLKDAFTGQLANIKAGKITREVAGERIGAIRAALAAAPDDLTAAQATAGIQNDALQALYKFSSRTDEMSSILKQQAAADLADLQRAAQSANATEARSIYDQSIKRLNQLTADMRNVELQAANQAGQTINRLAPQLQQRQTSMVNALREGMPIGQPLPGQATIHAGTEAAQRNVAAQAQAERIVPGQIPSISARQAAKTQAAAANQWQETSDIFADIAKQRRAEAGFIERQIGSLEDYGLRPLDAGAITGALDAKLAQPGLRASSNVTQVLQAVKGDIANLTQKGGGVIDAHDLYTLRKEGINERIMQIMGQTDPKISAKVTRKVLEEVRPLIDDAIERAGGTGWRDYLKTYSQGRQAIDQTAMAAQAVKLFQESPQEYVRLVRGNNPDAVEAIFGPGSYDIFKEMGSKMPTLEKVASNIERAGNMETAAAMGKERLTEVIADIGQTFPRFPNLLSREAAFGNVTFAELERRLEKKVVAKLREGALSGKNSLELLNALPTIERSKVLKVLTDPSTWGAKGAGAARAAVLPQAPTNNLAPQSENQNALAR
jgi:hypothetical protein